MPREYRMPRTLTYKVTLRPSRDGGYSVFVSALPGCVSEGESYEEALGNIREAIRGWLEVHDRLLTQTGRVHS